MQTERQRPDQNTPGEGEQPELDRTWEVLGDDVVDCAIPTDQGRSEIPRKDALYVRRVPRGGDVELLVEVALNGLGNGALSCSEWVAADSASSS